MQLQPGELAVAAKIRIRILLVSALDPSLLVSRAGCCRHQGGRAVWTLTWILDPGWLRQSSFSSSSCPSISGLVRASPSPPASSSWPLGQLLPPLPLCLALCLLYRLWL